MGRPKGEQKIGRTIRYEVQPLDLWLQERAFKRQKRATSIVKVSVADEIVNILRETYERENPARVGD